MVDYNCVDCGKIVKGVLVDRKIRCPFCGMKCLEKRQNRVLHSIKAV